MFNIVKGKELEIWWSQTGYEETISVLDNDAVKIFSKDEA